MMLRNDKKKSKEVSLYESIGTDKEGNVISLLDVIECDDIDIVEKYDMDLKTQWLYESLKKILTPREREIIIMRYGLGGNKEITQREMAQKLGISRSYVSRIEKKALLKLRNTYQKANKEDKETHQF